MKRRAVFVKADGIDLLKELLFPGLPLLDGVLHAQIHLFELHNLEFLRSIGVFIFAFQFLQLIELVLFILAEFGR